MKKIIAKLIWPLYLLTITICFLFFSHTDPLITNVQSYFYFNHINEFYDFSLAEIGTAAYLPSIYTILATWNFPLVILGLVNPDNLLSWSSFYPNSKLSMQEYAIFLSWYKLGILLLSLASFVYIKKIRQLIKANTYKSEVIYITSPFVIFSTMIFSGYDIFSVIFSLIGFYYFLKKDLIKFAIFFSIAITFKFFALIIFGPLLLLKEKKIIPLIKYSSIAISLTIITALPFIDNISFFRSILFVMEEKLSYGEFNLLQIAFISFYLSICIYALKFKGKNKEHFFKTSIYIAYLSYAALFFTTKFHPQWILLIMPFIALSYAFNKKKNYHIFFIEMLGFIAFIFLTINIWKNNIDQKMLAQGPLSQLLPQPQFMMADFFNFHSIKPLLMIIFYLYLAHPLYLEFLRSQKNENAHYLYLRFIIIYVFIFFSFFTVLPLKQYESLNPESQEIYQKSLKCLYSTCP